MTFRPGETEDLGTNTTGSSEGDQADILCLKRAEQKQEMIDASAKWKSDDSMAWGWDLEFREEDGVVKLKTSYGPCSIADLSPGEMADFLGVRLRGLQFIHPSGLEPKHGHVYLLDQSASSGHWVLFRFEIEG